MYFLASRALEVTLPLKLDECLMTSYRESRPLQMSDKI